MDRPTIDEVKRELRKRHDAGQKAGEDRLYLDALEYIEELQQIIKEN